MWLIHEIGLHDVVFWYLYHVSANICEVGAILCRKCGWKVELELKISIWKTQIFDGRASGGRADLTGKSCSQHFLQSWVSARAGYLTREQGFL